MALAFSGWFSFYCTDRESLPLSILSESSSKETSTAEARRRGENSKAKGSRRLHPSACKTGTLCACGPRGGYNLRADWLCKN